MVLLACKGEEKPSLSVSASKAAEHYYQCLINGDYQLFADGMLTSNLGTGYVTTDSLPTSYRRELADAAAQYAVKETKKRQGITAVKATHATVEADSVNALVDLEITFGDQSSEEILLPLLLTPEGWKMR